MGGRNIHGARKLALDYIRPLMLDGIRVLDVCAGDRWVHSEFPNVHYQGPDIRHGTDLTRNGWEIEFGLEKPDLILSIYALQHLLHEEAGAWTKLRRIAKPTTKFVYVGRFVELSGREINRADPLNAYDSEGFRGLATASGWQIVEFKTFYYQGDSYFPSLPFAEDCPPNAFAATLEPI